VASFFLIHSQRYARTFLNNFDFTNCRNPGWHLILAEAMYNATNERYYLNAAKIVVERVLERQTSNGGWKRFLTDDHRNCLPRHMGNAGFMVGIPSGETPFLTSTCFRAIRNHQGTRRRSKPSGTRP
jgi:rhamnogalacturonyl hydrolase YesR